MLAGDPSLNDSFADAGFSAGSCVISAGSLSVLKSLPAESLTDAGSVPLKRLLACESLAAGSFADAGSLGAPRCGSLFGELTGAGKRGAGVGVGVGFAAGEAGAATVAAVGAPEFDVGASGAGRKAFLGVRARGGSSMATL